MSPDPSANAPTPSTSATAESIVTTGTHTVDGASPARVPRAIGWLKRFAKLWGFALFCIFVVYVFRDVALPFVFAILVAYLLAPIVDRLSAVPLGSRRMPRGLAVVLVYIVILAMLGLGVGYFIPKLSGDFAKLFREAPELVERINTEWVPRAGAWVDQNLGAGTSDGDGPAAARPTPPPRELLLEPLPDGRYRVDVSGFGLEVTPGPNGRYLVGPPLVEDPPERGGGGRWERSIKRLIQEKVKSTELETKRAIEYGQAFVRGVVTGIARLVLVLMVAAFILIDLQRVRAFIRSLVPDAYRGDYDVIARGIDRGLSGVIRGQLIICLINGTLTYVGLLLFKVKYAILLAGIASIMSLVPIFGSILSSIPIVGIALVSSGTFDVAQGLYVLLWIIFIHLIEANYLNPKIMGDSARIHPVLVVFALIAGEHTYGLVGALFAVPVASIIQTFFVYFRRKGYVRSSAVTATLP
jgi:predicted PurR-regulated permease PerM